MTSPNLRAFLLAGMVTMAACGGGAVATQGPASTPASAGSTVAPAATSGPAATTPPIGAINACTLLTSAAIKAATGVDYGAGADDGYGQCTWLAGTGTVNTGDGQIVATFVDSDVATLKSTFSGGVDLTIAGRTAYWNPAAGVQTLWVDLDGKALALSFDPVDVDTQAIAVKIAEAALANL